AEVWFAVTTRLRLGTLFEAGAALRLTGYYDGVARSRALETISAARRAIAVAALRAGHRSAADAERWMAERGPAARRLEQRLADLTGSGGLGLSHLTVAAGLMRDLADHGD